MLQRLRVAKTYLPDQNGAKRFAKRHGDALVCVRHRLSQDGLTRFTTVELLAETTPVAPRQRSVIALRIPDSTKSMRSLLLACGAKWDAKHKLWLLPHMVAKGLRLLKYRAVLPG
ncbi:MAG: hypothetical protein HY855_01430 [Burkholderiales bacterium]|nr:hypothetical protein [Burkholderiales bacterium]